MKNLLLIFCLIILCKLNAQETLVPIKHLDKFGLSNLNKELKVEPIFDKIDFGIEPDYFVGFKKLEKNHFTTSLLHHDSIIIKDKPYFDYGIYDDFIVAVDTVKQETTKYHNLFYNEKVHLYNKDGNLLMPEYFAIISIYEDVKQFKKTSKSLVLFKDLNNKFSIRVYDSKTQKFIKTLLNKADELDFNVMDEWVWIFESMKLTYKKGDVTRKMEVKFLEDNFKIISDKKVSTTQKKRDVNRYNNYDDVEVPEMIEKPTRKVELPKNDSISKTLKEIGIVKNHKNFIETDYLYFENLRYQKDDFALGFKNGKMGLIDNKTGEYMLPTTYDAIYKMNYYYAFVIKKDNKYGVYFPFTKEFIEPIFDDIPIVVKKTERGKGINLLALFDRDTQNLKYYSTFKGDLFKID